jgi:hypothetical protein
MLVKEGEDLFRMPSQVIVTILEKSGRGTKRQQSMTPLFHRL